jgi:hypothetical protein
VQLWADRNANPKRSGFPFRTRWWDPFKRPMPFAPTLVQPVEIAWEDTLAWEDTIVLQPHIGRWQWNTLALPACAGHPNREQHYLPASKDNSGRGVAFISALATGCDPCPRRGQRYLTICVSLASRGTRSGQVFRRETHSGRWSQCSDLGMCRSRVYLRNSGTIRTMPRKRTEQPRIKVTGSYGVPS